MRIPWFFGIPFHETTTLITWNCRVISGSESRITKMQQRMQTDKEFSRRVNCPQEIRTENIRTINFRYFRSRSNSSLCFSDMFYNFTPIWGNDPIIVEMDSNRSQPPTSQTLTPQGAAGQLYLVGRKCAGVEASDKTKPWAPHTTDFPSNGGFVRKSSLFQGNLGWWNRIPFGQIGDY